MGYFHKANARLEEQVDRFFRLLSAQNDRYFGGELTVVLLGSLSRGEGSWYRAADGSEHLLSDIEFFTVCPRGFSERERFDRAIAAAAQAVFGGETSPFFHLDNSYLCITRLPRLEKKLLTYEAAVFGRCVVGKDVRSLFPPVDIRSINYLDIRNILVHRVFSVLYYGRPLKQSGQIEAYRYSLAKNSLDLMTVLLVSRGILEGGFARRLDRLFSLDIDEQLKRYFASCLRIKFSEPEPVSFSTDQMEEIFFRLVTDLSEHFRIPPRTFRDHFLSILRRKLGICKRGLRCRHPVFSQRAHLRRLLAVFRQGGQLTRRELLDNFVLNGYPAEKEWYHGTSG